MVREPALAVGEAHRRRRGDRGLLATVGRGEDPRHLREAAAPAPAPLGRELALDHPPQDRLLPLGLDLVGDDQSALARFLDLERIALNGLGVEEPAGHFGEPEQLHGAGGERRISGGYWRRPGGRRLREERLPAPERRRRRRAPLAMELE